MSATLTAAPTITRPDLSVVDEPLSTQEADAFLLTVAGNERVKKVRGAGTFTSNRAWSISGNID